MKHMYKFTTALILILVTLHTSYLIPHSHAQNKSHAIFSVSPAVLNISLSPGKVFTYDIRLKNLLTTPLPLRAQIDPAVEGETGVSSIATWASLSESDMIIPANGEKLLRLRIETPSKIPLGGYYGTLFLQPLTPSSQTAGQVIQARAGVVILANIGVPDPAARAEIMSLSFEKSRRQPGHKQVDFSVKNQSLYHFSAKPQLVIKPLLGQTKKVGIGEKIILPGKTREWTETIDWPYRMMNVYDVRLLVSVGNGEQILKETRYYDLPYKSIAVIVILTVAGIAAYKKRRNVMKAVRAFLQKD